MNLTFIEESHEYFLDEKPIPSVTQILGLANLYEFINANLLERASKFGTAVHKATQLYDEQRLNEATLDSALVPYLDSWKKFLSETNFKVIHIEQKVYSHLGFAGTFDRIGILDGRLTLLDIKTSTMIAKTTALQLAAYRFAWREMKKEDIENMVCVQLKPSGYVLKPYNDYLSNFEIFLNFLKAYKWINNYD